MESGEFERLLDAKLEPIKETIVRLERINEKMAEGLVLIARHDERVSSLSSDIGKCNQTHDILFTRINTIEHDNSSKVWAALMVFFGAIISGIIGMFFGKR